MKKIITLHTFILIIIGVVLFCSNKVFAKSDFSLSNMTCMVPVKVAGRSMEPTIKEGAMVFFNKCIDDKKRNLPAGTIILYSQFDRNKLTVIREKVTDERGGLYYKSSQEARPNEIDDVYPDNITGIYEPEESSKNNISSSGTTSNFRPNYFLILAGFLTMLVFWLPVFYWRKKTDSSWRYFWAGILVWSMMITIKVVMDLTITPKIALLGGIIITSLYAGLRTGIFESGLSYLYAKKKLNNADFSDAVFYGIAFGGVEALIIGLQSMIMVLLLVAKPDIINIFPAEVRQQITTVYSGSTLFIFAPVVERISALFIHIFTTVLVFLSVRKGSLLYLLISIWFKAMVDGMVLPLSQIQASSFLAYAYLVQIPIAIFALIAFLGIKKVQQIYPKPPILQTV